MATDFYISDLLDCYGAILSDKQYRILDGYYNNDLSLSEIAENEGITRQGVSDFIKRTEAQLFEFEAGLGFNKKVSALKAALEDVKSGKCDGSKLFDLIDKL